MSSITNLNICARFGLDHYFEHGCFDVLDGSPENETGSRAEAGSEFFVQRFHQHAATSLQRCSTNVNYSRYETSDDNQGVGNVRPIGC